MRTPRASSAVARATASPNASTVSIASGARGSGPACRSSIRARSSALRAIGPQVGSWVTKTSSAGPYGTRPWLGRSPSTWFQPAGLRRLPMKSEPSATASIRVASATAAPPLDPPAVLVLSQALRVVP